MQIHPIDTAVVVVTLVAVVRDGLVYLYCGVCETGIALASAPLDEIVRHVLAG